MLAERIEVERKERGLAAKGEWFVRRHKEYKTQRLATGVADTFKPGAFRADDVETLFGALAARKHSGPMRGLAFAAWRSTL